MKPVIIYFIAWLSSTVLYLLATKILRKNYEEWKEDWNKLRKNQVKLTRKMDLQEQYRILLELHEIQENYPNVSKHDRAMMNSINYYIEKTTEQLRNLDNKKELSEIGSKQTTQFDNVF